MCARNRGNSIDSCCISGLLSLVSYSIPIPKPTTHEYSFTRRQAEDRGDQVLWCIHRLDLTKSSGNINQIPALESRTSPVISLRASIL
ncbi:hypothetical protein Dimus_015645, partial [Dionaea muscipula]